MSSSIDETTSRDRKSQPRPQFDWTALKKALAFYESEGLCCLPAYWGHKDPYVKWEEFQNRLPTRAEKADWFREGKPTNIGILCGGISGGLVMLCFNDTAGAAEFFGEERWQKLLKSTFITQSVRGCHVCLRSENPIKSQQVGKGKNKSWLEIRSDGNFTVAPPSLHPDGVLYEAIGVDRIHKPDDLASFIDKRLSELGLKAREAETPKGISGNEPGWVQQALQGVPEGERDHTCTKLAGYFKNHLPQDVTLSVLITWGERCEPPFPPQEVRKVVTSVYRYGEAIEEPEEEQVQPLL
ncbi:MAG: bifunctional DNA primase/polymerase, partial [Candidatus Latescibacteria bacterium]|nr:bifunctional DNA primase/polymerase [Candidatus Latescibacterota bacterium]